MDGDNRQQEQDERRMDEETRFKMEEEWLEWRKQNTERLPEDDE